MKRSDEILLKIIKIFLLIIFPPLGVYLFIGFSGQFWLNLLLTILGYIPGLIHGIYIISSQDVPERD